MAKAKSTSLTTTGKLPARVLADRVIEKLREAERALQQATTIHQAKIIADVAAAQELFAHRQKLGETITRYAHEIKIYALAKLGELIKVMPKADGGDAQRTRYRKGTESPPTYAELGLTKKTVEIARGLAGLALPVRDAIAHQETTITKALSQQRAADVVATVRRVEIPAGRFRVLYADPPWAYATPQHSTTEQVTVLGSHYPSMSIGDICALPVPQIAASHAVLFLWVTSPLLFEAPRVLEAWGFTYKAAFIWDKVKHNVGHYNSVRHELLLVATRGSCLPDVPTLYDSVVSIERTAHSVKPAHFREMIDAMYPPVGQDRIELFARGTLPPAWVAWGNQHG